MGNTQLLKTNGRFERPKINAKQKATGKVFLCIKCNKKQTITNTEFGKYTCPRCGQELIEIV